MPFLTPDDERLIARAANRYVGLSNAGDNLTCKWCEWTNHGHAPDCPTRCLIDIVMLICSGDEPNKNIARQALEDDAARMPGG